MNDKEYSIDLKTLVDNIKNIGADHGEVQLKLNGACVQIMIDLNDTEDSK